VLALTGTDRGDVVQQLFAADAGATSLDHSVT
jgi:hypothetical protein